MPSLYEPSLSYWYDKGNDVQKEGICTPAGALNQTSLVLLIHGFNNDRKDASDSYKRYLELQNKLVTVNAHVVGVYWPGDNWEGPLYYMQSVKKAEQTAPRLAKDLYLAARGRGYLKISIIAHSLGCRLALETVKQLLKIKQETDPALGGLILDKIAFMAGAVPTQYLESIKELQLSLTTFNSTLSIYSENDSVLRWAFPLGQSLVGQGFFPTALGRKKWMEGENLLKRIEQKPNHGAGHSDYWGGSSEKLEIQENASKILNDFLPIGSLDSRMIASNAQLPIRTLPSLRSGRVREVMGRVISSRA